MRKSAVLLLLILLMVFGAVGIYIARRFLNLQVPFISPMNQISNNTIRLIQNIRNEDVIWTGNFLGLEPTELTGPTLSLLDNQENIDPLLVDALLDQDRFVAAHVLLTMRTSEIYKFSASHWNGLQVQLQSDGKVFFIGNDLVELHEHWKEKLSK